MNRAQRQALQQLGVTTRSYFLEGDYEQSWEEHPEAMPIWGLALEREGETLAVIESGPPEIDRRFYLRRTPRGIALEACKLQRLAIAAAARRGLLG